MIKTNDQPADETRRRLLEAALDCFAEAGFDGATTRAICGRAGVNLALLNYHFGSKEGLWAQVLRTLNDRLAAVALTVPDGPLPSRLEAFLRAAVREVLRDPRPLRVMTWAQLRPDPAHGPAVEAAWEPVVRLAVAALEAEQRAGRLAAEVDVGLAVITFYGLLAEPVVEPQVHRRLFGVAPSDPAHRARIEDHLVRSGLRLLGFTHLGGSS